MFGCAVTVLQNMASSSNIFLILHQWIPGSTKWHTIAIANTVSYNEKKSRICVTAAVNLKLIYRNK